MGATSLWHWVIIAVIVLLVFGSGRVPALMGDLASGIRSFKRSMAEPDPAPEPPAPAPPQPDRGPALAAEPPQPVDGR